MVFALVGNAVEVILHELQNVSCVNLTGKQNKEVIPREKIGICDCGCRDFYDYDFNMLNLIYS